MTVKSKPTYTTKKKQTTPPQATFSLISNERLLEMYAALLQCRQLEQYARRQMKPRRIQNHGLGQEATAAGVLLHLQPEDVLAPPIEGNLSHSFLRGTPIALLLTPLVAKPERAGKHKNKKKISMATGLQIVPASATLEQHLSIVTGLALAYKLQKKTTVVAAFFNANSIHGDHWQHSLHFAAEHALPMLFICHSAVGSEGDDSPQLNPGMGSLPSIAVDADDVVAVYRVAQEAISHAREGTGPTLIQAVSFNNPISKHSATVSDPIDSIFRMESYLTRKGLYSPQFKQQTLATFGKKLDAAVRSAKSQIQETK